MKTDTRITRTVLGTWLVGIVTLGLVPQAKATLMLYEGFNYGGTAMDLNAVSGSALGLDGTAYAGSGNVKYQSAGLSFGSLSVTGGNAGLSTYDNGHNVNRGLDFNLTSGTLHGSFLFNPYGDAGGDNGIAPVMFGATTGDNTVELALAGNTGGTGGQRIGIKSYGNTTAATGQTSLEVNTTYLVLFQVTNMGAANGDTQDINMWALSLNQFENFKAGGLTTSELNSAALGVSSADVMQRISYTLTIAGGNNISLTDTETMTLFNWRSKYLVDEIRLSDFSLDEVTPVLIPEPSTYAMMALGLGSLYLLRRQRRV